MSNVYLNPDMNAEQDHAFTIQGATRGAGDVDSYGYPGEPRVDQWVGMASSSTVMHIDETVEDEREGEM